MRQKDNVTIISDLQSLASQYEVEAFISTDPVQFPRRYSRKQDIEISGFISAWLAYGSRQVFIPLLNRLHELMGDSPYTFIMEQGYLNYQNSTATMYRFCKWKDLYETCFQLNKIYADYSSMEDWILQSDDQPLHMLQKQFGHIPQIPLYNGSSACKKLHMFLRWMIRDNSPVDLGIWSRFDKRDLLIPVDTHVLSQAQEWNITSRKQADKKTVEEITSFARTVFPDDPARLDFALYGYAVSLL